VPSVKRSGLEEDRPLFLPYCDQRRMVDIGVRMDSTKWEDVSRRPSNYGN